MQKQQKKLATYLNDSISKIIKIVALLVLLALGIAYRISSPQKQQPNINQNAVLRYAVIGDVGGTNIRYQLVSFKFSQMLPIEVVKQQRLKVVEFETFQDSFTYFLSDISPTAYPNVAVIAIAGPIEKNTVTMPNILKWGELNGTTLALKYNISYFSLINDFEAISYGLLIVDDSQLIQLNNLPAQPSKIRGVIGPGTGLGHSIIFNNQFVEDGITVLPSQAGHSDAPLIDEETNQYVQFLRTKTGPNIDLEKTFCGPSIPVMYQFFIKKINPNQTFQPKDSTQIVQECLKQQPSPVYDKVFNLFIKLYSSAIANFMIQHMTTGGVYLVGGLTKALLQKIKKSDILKEWKERHPDMRKVVQKIPVIFSNEIDLGLKGAFVMAKRLARKCNQRIQQRKKAKQVQDIF